MVTYYLILDTLYSTFNYVIDMYTFIYVCMYTITHRICSKLINAYTQVIVKGGVQGLILLCFIEKTWFLPH